MIRFFWIFSGILCGIMPSCYGLVTYCVSHTDFSARGMNIWHKTPDYVYTRTIFFKKDGTPSKETCGVFLEENDRTFLSESFGKLPAQTPLTQQLANTFIRRDTENGNAAFIIITDFLRDPQLGKTIGDLRKKLNLPANDDIEPDILIPDKTT